MNAQSLSVFYGTVPLIATILIAVWSNKATLDQIGKLIDSLERSIEDFKREIREEMRDFKAEVRALLDAQRVIR